MSDVTHILSAIENGDPSAAEQLLPLVYEELRKLAAHRLAQEKSGQTLQATALVHDAYLRLVDVDKAQHWNGRGHFFAAAAEAMRRILIEIARRKGGPEAGGRHVRVELTDVADLYRSDLDLLALALADLDWVYSNYATEVAVADLNADGKLDAVTANEDTGTVSVLLGAGTVGSGYWSPAGS